jgi:hypothetical protein
LERKVLDCCQWQRRWMGKVPMRVLLCCKRWDPIPRWIDGGCVACAVWMGGMLWVMWMLRAVMKWTG